jgi:hypothetical protein
MPNTITQINEIVDVLASHVSRSPNGAFFMPLRDILWVPVLHDAALRPAQTIKYGLIKHLKEFTYALDNPRTHPHGELFKISVPTVNKYLKMFNDGKATYNKRTWDNLFELISAAPLKLGWSMSQFWWRYCNACFPEIINLLADKSDPFQSQAQSFWQLPRAKKKGLAVNLSTMGFMCSYMVMLKALGPRLTEKDSKAFRSTVFLTEVKTATESPENSNEELVAMVLQVL